MTAPPDSPRTTELPWTIRRVVAWAAADLAQRQIESPRLNAELLLGHALKLTRLELILEAHRPLLPAELARYKELLKRKWTGEPTAYLLGVREFFGYQFAVDPRVLIPRPDTETLVEVALTRLAATEADGPRLRVLDLCTGSGCVALALGRKRPDLSTIGVDLSRDALELAEQNRAALGLTELVSFVYGDLFDALTPGEPFDAIVSNPPYVPSLEIATLEPSVQHFEPHLALDGGEDGLCLVRRIIQEAPSWLADGGLLALEIGAGQSSIVDELMRARGFRDIVRSRDYGGHERVVSGILATSGAPQPLAAQ
jgi:release factor glutamine methyltransferase